MNQFAILNCVLFSLLLTTSTTGCASRRSCASGGCQAGVCSDGACSAGPYTGAAYEEPTFHTPAFSGHQGALLQPVAPPIHPGSGSR